MDNDGAAGPTDPDLARSVLSEAQALARTLPNRGRRREPGRRGGAGTVGPRDDTVERRGGYSAPGADPARDPQRVGAVLGDYVEARGWDRPLAEARVFTDWAGLVGDDVAAHCLPQSLRQGELRIAAESTAWATQLRLLGSTLLARLVGELGPQVVTRLHISGPVGPNWNHGPRTVRGRGPRDTYG